MRDQTATLHDIGRARNQINNDDVLNRPGLIYTSQMRT